MSRWVNYLNVIEFAILNFIPLPTKTSRKTDCCNKEDLASIRSMAATLEARELTTLPVVEEFTALSHPLIEIDVIASAQVGVKY